MFNILIEESSISLKLCRGCLSHLGIESFSTMWKPRTSLSQWNANNNEHRQMLKSSSTDSIKIKSKFPTLWCSIWQRSHSRAESIKSLSLYVSACTDGISNVFVCLPSVSWNFSHSISVALRGVAFLCEDIWPFISNARQTIVHSERIHNIQRLVFSTVSIVKVHCRKFQLTSGKLCSLPNGHERANSVFTFINTVRL